MDEHMSFVQRMARAFKCFHPLNIVELSDLINAGFIGLLKAKKCYDETRGVKFETYAEKFVWRQMAEEIRKYHSVVIPRHLCEPEKRKQWKGTPQLAAADFVRSCKTERSDLNIGDRYNGFNEVDDKDEVEVIMRRMPTERHRQVLRWRYYDGLDGVQIAERLGCSKQRVSKIEGQCRVFANAGRKTR
jgi:RNA polymerase sigma factor (sigma-70 family)